MFLKKNCKILKKRKIFVFKNFFVYLQHEIKLMRICNVFLLKRLYVCEWRLIHTHTHTHTPQSCVNPMDINYIYHT